MNRNSLFENVVCDLCGTDQPLVLYSSMRDKQEEVNFNTFRSSGDEKLKDRLVKCNNCGFIYVSPRLNSSFVMQYYINTVDEAFVSQASGRERTFKNSLKIIEGFWRIKPGKILDIGTAGGSFLHAARQKGWDVYGCEPNRWLCNWSKKHYGIDVNPGTIFQQKYNDGFFDVVTLWDVLEHTPDPKKVLQECRRILKPKGLLVVNYPDMGSWIAKMMGRKWVFLLSVHLYYFTRQTMAKMLKDCGFLVLKIKPHYQQLALSYIFSRSKTYVGPIGAMGENISRMLGMGDLNIPYWAGQTLVIAKKA